MSDTPTEQPPAPDMEEVKEFTPQQKKELSDKAQQKLDSDLNVEVPKRRVRMLMVNPSDFCFLFTKGLEFKKHTKIIKGAPEDAEVIALVADSVRNGVMLVVKSESYDEVPINVLPPVESVEIDMGIKGATKKKKAPRKKRK